MTDESMSYLEALTEIKRLKEALEQKPCEDAISRKDMLAVFRQSNSLSQAWNGFEKLPPVTPKPKTGKWKVQHTNLSHLPSDTIVTCLECGHTKSRIDGEILNFCPKCGARMVSK